MTDIMFLKTGLKPEWFWVRLYDVEFGIYSSGETDSYDLLSFHEKLSSVFSFACPRVLFYTSPFDGGVASPAALGQALVIKELSLLYGFRAVEVNALELCHFFGNPLPDERDKQATAPCCPRFPGMNFPVCGMDCVCNRHEQQYIRRPESYQMTVFQENC